ncbi:MAG TPA: MobF family relaxase, partial [Steroidobacteraceae bacterium]|nr:MobF family relaxase [Steroidobacteraceae bacterium]
MLTIKSIGTDPKRQLYYDSQIAQGRDDYYAGNGEAPGEFVGTGTAALGLTDEITRDQLIAMFAGRNPNTGEQLAKRGARSTVTGFDLTFSAPKSISVLYAVGNDEMARLLTEAHDQAVREALAYMESNAARVRRGHNGTQAERDRGDARGFERARSVAAEGFVAGAYRHRMSRNQDPQLHTHVVVMNMAKGPEGRWTALDGQHLYAHVKATGFVYQAHLRQAVRQRLEWVDWADVRNGMAELSAEQVAPEVLKRFSSRRAEIVEKARELVGAGTRVGPKGMERIALDTREPKREIADADWHEMVRAIAAEHGLGRDEITYLKTLEPSAWDTPLDEAALADELFSPEGLTDNANTFHERDVVMRIAAAYRQGLTVPEIRKMARRVMEHGQVVEIPDTNDRRFTTRELLEREEQIISLAEAGRGQGVAVLTPAQVATALAGLPFQLSEEQMGVLLSVAGSGNQIDTVEALAGTGKTTTANAVRLAYEAAGYKVIGAAPTGRAQTELLERAGITEARTIDSWLLAMEKHPHGPAAVFAFATGSGARARPQAAVMVLDEAGMAHTRKSAQIIQAAVDAGIKVIAVGDSGQLASVGAGGWLGAITRLLGSYELREVMRQRDAEERRLL